ncbi:hypothetical protein BU17DRAFT_57049 [Hysterangium stoloniferum]|nr:hypothetical protein BU17DRAFT_57049 [Hysterangium stoloniferum]
MPSFAESTVVAAAPDTDELAQFRQRWKDEIRTRGSQGLHPESSSSEAQEIAPAPGPSTASRLTPALETYARAISEEQRGSYAEATRLYRNAFRLDSNVDKAYHREELARQRQNTLATVTAPAVAISLGSLSINDSPSVSSKISATTETLATLLGSWPELLSFMPDNEAHPTPIDRLPNELIMYILFSFALNTDICSIERFAAVCRRARIISLDASLWRRIVESIMVPCQLADPSMSLEQLSKQYHSDYRRMFIEHPRVRFDGVYISICHYVRNGLGENPWVTVSHLITYRRFLRFLPNGKVLSYRANEDKEIGDVVHALHPGLIRKDLYVGDWQLTGTRVLVTNLVDVMPFGQAGNDRYFFQMNLNLKSRPSPGRWNKLDILEYDSVDVETGDICPFPLRHERPYWFSKVKSYQTL